MNNLLSCCGLVDAKIRASDKDLPVGVTTVHQVHAQDFLFLQNQTNIVFRKILQA